MWIVSTKNYDYIMKGDSTVYCLVILHCSSDKMAWCGGLLTKQQGEGFQKENDKC